MSNQPFKLTLFDDPYVSSFLASTISRLKVPVVATPKALSIDEEKKQLFITSDEAVRQFKNLDNALVYTHSENSLAWIENNLGETRLASLVRFCKNKIHFRETLKDLYPRYWFRGVKLNEIDEQDYHSIPKPFVIKPAAGFLSLGVHTVYNENDWEKVRSRIHAESIQIRNLYPSNVLDTTNYIMEAMITGDEYAIDCYYTSQGEPVVLGIYKHIFASENDVSDRVYITSHRIMNEMLLPVEDFLKQIGEKMLMRNFPVHVEIRMDESGLIQPIELNPLRFGGWCTTADMAAMSFGINAYEYYFEQKVPDWKTILSENDSAVYSIVVLDNKSGIDFEHINHFDYHGLVKKFGEVMEIREIDFKKHPLFGFLFLKTPPDQMEEISYILSADLREFIS